MTSTTGFGSGTTFEAERMWRPRRQDSKDDVNYLDMVPVRCVAFEQRGDPPRIVVLMPRFRDPILGRLLQPRLQGDRRFIRVPLDLRGSWLWPLIDGRRTVGELAVLMLQAFPSEGRRLEERLCLYVASLAGHGFLRVKEP